VTVHIPPELTADYAQTPDTMFTTDLLFDYPRPPLTANQRLHWRRKAAITRDIREATALLARRIPSLTGCDVRLTWYVTDKRRRDADNLVPTLKAMCDGLVDADVAPDDTPDLMTKHMPVIFYEPAGIARMVLTVTGVAA
jgi:crossover junction endodeoxyribonuclease RusA